MVKAIETSYAGHRFRSRLEARWAVFFDALGIKWEYESQGYMIGDRPYLPDFWLPKANLWVEVKGQIDDEGISLLRKAVAPGNLPHITDRIGGLLLLGDIPRIDFDGKDNPWFPVPMHVVFTRFGRTLGFFKLKGFIVTMHADEMAFDTPLTPGVWPGLAMHPIVLDAYHKARIARFEHGETPLPPATNERPTREEILYGEPPLPPAITGTITSGSPEHLAIWQAAIDAEPDPKKRQSRQAMLDRVAANHGE